MQVLHDCGDGVYYYDPHEPITASELWMFIKKHNLENANISIGDSAIYFHNGFSEDGCLYFENMMAILTSCNPDEYELED